MLSLEVPSNHSRERSRRGHGAFTNVPAIANLPSRTGGRLVSCARH